MAAASRNLRPWRFQVDGHCTAIPSLTPSQTKEVGRIRCGAYPCREMQGSIRVYIPGKSARLPGLRIEVIEGDKHSAVGLTAITPLSETETEVHQALCWTLHWRS